MMMLKRLVRPLQLCQKRYLDLYEAQAKQLFVDFDIRHQRGFTAHTAAEAVEKAQYIMDNFGCENIIVKAQVLAGGRGKGYFDTGYQGGVKFCTDLESVADAAENMLGNRIHTVQTPTDGIHVKQLFVAECLDFEDELYFAMLLDRECDGPVIVASKEGGVEIEVVAEENPDAIKQVPISTKTGPIESDLDQLAADLGITSPDDIAEFKQISNNMFDLLMEKDLLQIEINPLVAGDDGIICLDAKVGVDDNALFRQPEINEDKDLSELDDKEIEAIKHHLEYIALDGNIGCLVNGAGLAMATMDIIKLHGGEPANFLDVGGGATVDQVREAFKIITADENVQAILVNIFGGIMQCDVIAAGIIEACEQVDLKVPLVVRLAGTNSEIGNKMLDECGLPIDSAEDLDDAAKKAVASLK